MKYRHRVNKKKCLIHRHQVNSGLVWWAFTFATVTFGPLRRTFVWRWAATSTLARSVTSSSISLAVAVTVTVTISPTTSFTPISFFSFPIPFTITISILSSVLISVLSFIFIAVVLRRSRTSRTMAPSARNVWFSFFKCHSTMSKLIIGSRSIKFE